MATSLVSWLVWFPLKLLLWALAAVGVVALTLTAMIATPLRRPPELHSISETAGAVDRSTMPELQRFSARDGTVLSYRHYPARGAARGTTAILVYGSSGSSAAVHALADAPAAHGVETYAPDIRGHGGSGTRGDYFMLFYCIAGLWFGHAFIAIGLGVTVLTLIRYFFITSDIFLLWMGVVNGGGLIVSGLWMRWGE